MLFYIREETDNKSFVANGLPGRPVKISWG